MEDNFEPNYKNDNLMTYDLTNHRYVLTAEGAYQYGVDIYDLFSDCEDPDTSVKKFLERASIRLYSYIYRSNILTKDIKEWMLSLPQYREQIMECLQEFVYVLAKNGTDPDTYFRDNQTRYVVDGNTGTHTPNYSRGVTQSVQDLLDVYGFTFAGRYFNCPSKDELLQLKTDGIY